MFKLILNETTYDEYGRNDQYVIFNISGKELEAYGPYDICDQDNEHIATGTYTLI